VRSRLIPIAAAAMALAVAAPAGAAFRGTNGEIAYEGRASATTGTILLASHDGGSARRLSAPGQPADPAFSPLGRRIAFGSRSEVWVMYEDGTSVRQVTVSPEPARDPSWSPDAAAIAYTRGYAGDRDIYSVGADGNGARQLTTGSHDDWAPAWGPTGAIAFVRDGDVYVKAPRKRARPLTAGGADDRDPVWSPDGRRLAFTRLAERAPAPRARKGKKRRPAPRLRELWVMRAGGGHARRLKKLRADVSSPAWSPDGRSIAFAMGRNGRRGLYTLRTTGRGLRQVASRAADPRAIDWQARGRDPVIGTAGDIACDPDLTRYSTGLGTRDACHMLQTSDLLLKMDLSAVIPLGDLQYENGTLDKFQRSYEPTWGRLKAQTRPVVGNHEYRTPGASGYFDYFNGPGVFDGPAGARDKGYYSYDLGAWHVVTLNSQCSHAPADNPYKNDCAVGSPQEQWLRADLAAHPNRCTLAAWHHPWFSAGLAGVNDRVRPLFQALYDHGVDVLLTGHDHGYERFAPMDTAFNRDPARGVRQFVVGTGGKNEETHRYPQPNSEVRAQGRFGVLELTLRPSAYTWEFKRDGGTFEDSGANACH
jgi:Tol biopolymer transport system component